MPKVLFNISFTPPTTNATSAAAKLRHASDRAFYTCNAKYNYFSYTNANGKVVIDESEKTKPEQGLAPKNYMEKTSGIFNQKGVLNAKQKAELEEKLKTTKSIIWHGFISFDNDTSPLFNTQKACIDFIRSTMSVYFKQNGLNEDKLVQYYSLHQDTEHNHIHFGFFEDEADKIVNGKKQFRKAGVFGKKIGEEYHDETGKPCNKDDIGAKKVNLYFDRGRDFFLYGAEEYLQNNSLILRTLRDATTKTFNKNSAETLRKEAARQLRVEIISLSRDLPRTGRLSYSSQDMAGFQPRIDAIAQHFINLDPELRLANDRFVHQLFASISHMKKFCKDEGISFKMVGKQKFDDVYKQYRSRLGNRIIRLARTCRFDIFNDTGKLSCQKARKIAAKYDRRNVSRAIANELRRADHMRTVGYDYSQELHRVEYEIRREQENRYSWGE